MHCGYVLLVVGHVAVLALSDLSHLTGARDRVTVLGSFLRTETAMIVFFEGYLHQSASAASKFD